MLLIVIHANHSTLTFDRRVTRGLKTKFTHGTFGLLFSYRTTPPDVIRANIPISRRLQLVPPGTSYGNPGTLVTVSAGARVTGSGFGSALTAPHPVGYPIQNFEAGEQLYTVGWCDICRNPHIMSSTSHPKYGFEEFLRSTLPSLKRVTLLGLQSHIGDKSLNFRGVCPQNGDGGS